MVDQVAAAEASRSGRQRRRSVPPLVPYRTVLLNLATLFIGYFLAATAITAGASLYPSAVWAYAALVIFVAFCVSLLKRSPVTFLLFAPLLALRMTEFLSGAAIESGAYMIETASYGHPTGAFAHLLMIYILFFLTAAAATEAFWPRVRRLLLDAEPLWDRSARLLWWSLVGVVAIASLYLLRLGINNGFPILTGADRFGYLEKLNSPYYKAILLNRLILIPIVGVLFSVPAYRLRALLMIAWILMWSILFSEKFSSLLLILTTFVMPAGLMRVARGRDIPVQFVGAIAAVVAVITIPAVLIVYGATSDFNGAMQRYGQRAALQGQLWFKTDERFLSFTNYDPNAIEADIASWVVTPHQDATKVGTDFGLYYVMQKFTPTRTLGWAMEAGGGFVFSLYPYLLLVTGLPGMLLISSLIALYHAWVMRLVVEAIARANWLSLLLLGRVMSSFYACYATGYLWNIMGVKTLAPLAVGWILLREFSRRNIVLGLSPSGTRRTSRRTVT